MIRVLIVDDLAENRYMLEMLLKGNGYDVVTASNGAEALDLARKVPPDVIITDILMPVMDGFTLCQQWKADDRLKTVPFVFYTATYTDPKDEQFAMSLGAERFIVKPKRPDEMIELLHQVLDDARAGRLAPSEQPVKAEEEFLRDHNATLLRKLEMKMEQLERTNAALQQEIAEREKTGRELVYRNTVLSTQQETSLDAILIVDAEGRIISYNKRCVELWEIPEEVIATRSDERALKSVLDKLAAPELFLKKVKDLYDHRDQTSRDLVELKEGRVLDRYSAPIIGAEGTYYGRVWYFRDITEQRKLEEQLRQAQKMEAIGTLAGGVAHDFNNILSAIMGYASLLQKNSGTRQAASAHIDHILQATKSAAGLTKGLLQFSRRQSVDLRPVDIKEIIHGFQRMMARIIGADIEFTVDCGGDALVVEADAGQLEQVLMNLVMNARDAMPTGGKLSITTGVFVQAADRNGMKHGPYAVMTVSDTGTGMDKETQGRIFEPFFTTKGEGKGTGLGLATAYGIVKKHNGLIRVYSEPGRGTTFRIYLPLTGGALPELPETAEALLPPGTETLLLVEDDVNVRFVMADMLKEYGYTVLEAANGEDALRVFQENESAVKLVLCDLILPKKSGKETLGELRKERPGLKAIFTSGYTADIIAEKGLLEKGMAFLSKPVSMIDLVRKVREVLDS